MKRLAAVLSILVLMSACGLNEHGPWLDRNGNQMRGSDMIEYDGFALCDQQQVVFIQFFGDQYAKDPAEILGELTSPESGEPISFDVLESVPTDLEGTEITHDGREIYIGEDRQDYLYVRLPSGETERWPRAEDTCERSDPL